MFKILKFGGTSIGSAENMKAIVPLLKSTESQIIVLSAMGGTTNSLIFIAESLHSKQYDTAAQIINLLETKYLREINKLYKSKNILTKSKGLLKYHFDYLRSFISDSFTIKEEKAVVAQGEILSTTLFHYYLEEINISSVLLQALNFMRIGENGEPDLNYIEKNLKTQLDNHKNEKIFITQGYICRNAYREIDNLKRGGSDYTASLIGAAVMANEIQIWTDINGIHNNDPRIVSKTYPIEELNFDEAAELAYFGAKILHPTCILPAQKKNIHVRLLNTLQPSAKGTLIHQHSKRAGIKAVAAKDNITAISIKSHRMLLAYGFLRNVFEIFECYRTPIDMITTSEVAVSVTIDDNKFLKEIVEELKEFSEVMIDHNQTIICIVGECSYEKNGYANKVFESLKEIPIRMISYGGSANNISVLLNSSLKKDALLALNKGLFNY